MKILWIDDDSYQTKTLKELFELYSYSVDFYCNYEAAYFLLEKDPKEYDAIILDVMLPFGKMFGAKESRDGTITGLLLYKKIRNFYKGPVIIYSIIRDVRIINQYIKNDDNAKILNKPCRIDHILNTIMELNK